MGNKPKKFLLIFVIVLMLVMSISNVVHTNSLEVVTTRLNKERDTSEDLFGRSNITVSAHQNVTFSPTNNSIDIGLFSQIRPTDLSLDIVKGFEPVERFNSPYNYSFIRGDSWNNSLREVDDGLQLFFSTKDQNQPAISVYNMSFASSVNVSRNDFLSLAISTESSYDSSEGYIGFTLLLRDQQGSRHYVFIHISDLFSKDEYGLSTWFLGHSYGKQYPQYSIRYRSSFGPCFMQLALFDSFSSLNLSSAWLDGLLIGAELYSIPLPYATTQVDARLHYALVHPQPFSINQKVVNSTVVILPPTRYLNISGISGKRLNTLINGSLRPSYESEVEQEDKTVKVVDMFYNFSQPFFYNFSEAQVHEVRFEGRVNITVLSKTVRKCIITLNNITNVDLTEDLLGSNKGLLYRFLSDISLLRVFLVLYKFNAWIFDLETNSLHDVTKKGIIEEYFVSERNESVVVIDPNKAGLRDVNIAVGAGYFSSGELSVNDVGKPLNSLLVLNKVMFLAASVKMEENVSLYTIRCRSYSDPIYYSSTVQPFKVLIDNALFEIYTPFNIEAQPRVQIPLTLGTYTLTTTYRVKVEYDSSMLEVDNDELMINKIFGYEYFMLKPIGLGSTAFTVHFIEPSIENFDVSISFLVSIQDSLFYQMIPYVLFTIVVLSFVYIIGSKNLVDWLKRGRKR